MVLNHKRFRHMIPAAPTVYIEQGPDVPAVIREGVLDGCNQGLGPSACSEAQLEPDGSPYAAQLTWGEEYQTVTIVITLGPERQVRSIRFQPQDPADTKGVVAGLVAATAVATHLSLTQKQASAEPPKGSEPASTAEDSASSSTSDSAVQAPTTSNSAVRATSTWRTDLGFLLGSGLNNGPPSWGASGRVSVLGPLGEVFPVLGLSYSRSGGDIEAGRLRSWLGFGWSHELGRSPLSLEPSGGVLGEQLVFTASNEDSVEHATRWRVGGLAALDLVWRLNKTVHPFVGAQISAAWPEVELVETGSVVDYQSVMEYNAFLGLRLNL